MNERANHWPVSLPSGSRYVERGNRLPAPVAAEWSATVRNAGLESERVEQRSDEVFEDLGIRPDLGHQFFQHIPPRLAKLRLEICSLGRAQTPSQQQACLVSISMQCQWLAGYARMSKFNALAQVAGALEVFVKEISDRALRVSDSMLRTFAQTVELLNALSSCAPTKTGRAEGARVLVLDEVAATRLSMLAALERVQIAGIGIASVDTGFGLLNENSVDLIVVRTDSAASMAPRLCQAIRRMPKQVNTPILVLLPEGDWERCAVLAMSGANEVIAGRLLNAELALKVLGHFFRGRLGGAA